MNHWQFFQRVTCLTLGPDWPKACEEFERVGLEGVWRFDALPDIGPHQSFNRSTRRILSDFAMSGASSLLFFEDDVVFRDLAHLEKALSELPADWDVVYLGANLLNGQPVRYSEHLFRVKSAWTTHAIGYNKKVIPFLLDNQPDANAEMFDNALSRWLPDLQAFVVAPMVAYQRFHKSSIWQTTEDYTPHFEASDARLI